MRKVKYRVVTYVYDSFMKVSLPRFDNQEIKEGLFHEWSFDKEGPVGIIETEDGHIEIVKANLIQFIKYEYTEPRPRINTAINKTPDK